MRCFSVRNATVGDLSQPNTSVFATSNTVDGNTYTILFLEDGTERALFSGVEEEGGISYLSQLKLDVGLSVDTLEPSSHPFVGDGLDFAVVEYSEEEITLLKKIPPLWTTWSFLTEEEKNFVGQQVRAKDSRFGDGVIGLSLINGWKAQAAGVAPVTSENFKILLISLSSIESFENGVPVLGYRLLETFLPAEGFPLSTAKDVRQYCLMHFAKWPRSVRLSSGVKIINQEVLENSEMNLPFQSLEVTSNSDVFPDDYYYANSSSGPIVLDLPQANFVVHPRRSVRVKRVGANGVSLQCRANLTTVNMEPFSGFSEGDTLGLIVDGNPEVTYSLVPADLPFMSSAAGSVSQLSPQFPTVEWKSIGTLVKRIQMRSLTQGSLGSIEIGPSTSPSFLSLWGVEVGQEVIGYDFEGGSSKSLNDGEVVEMVAGTVGGTLTWINFR